MASILAGAILLACSGVAYRVTAASLDAAVSERIMPDRPLDTLPMVLGDWAGERIELAPEIVRVAGIDDHVSRVYRNLKNGDIVTLYVSYTGRPRTMLGHRPTICYPNTGHSHTRTEQVEIVCGDNRSPALIHTFVKPRGVDQLRTMVLNYYVLGGNVTVDENSFAGMSWRTPNLARDATRYVAQVQVAATVGIDIDSTRTDLIKFAEESIEEILDLLPNASKPSARLDHSPAITDPDRV